ncbi:hypothetical protein ACFTY8_48245 [Streptomyces mirabilis]|uniref:hypothetical protein n=1 Tax=Streptomyces mirabilis TaxID=68239 RepID=UPI0036433149
MFTQECDSAGKVTNADASFALTQISGQEGFATLRSAAQKIQKAAATYQQLGCATNPTKAATSKEPASSIQPRALPGGAVGSESCTTPDTRSTT